MNVVRVVPHALDPTTVVVTALDDDGAPVVWFEPNRARGPAVKATLQVLGDEVAALPWEWPCR